MLVWETSSQRLSLTNKSVSILVLLDAGLGERTWVIPFNPVISFNPCFVGCWSGSKIFSYMISNNLVFQSLFCWMLVWELIISSPYCFEIPFQSLFCWMLVWELFFFFAFFIYRMLFQSLFCWMLVWEYDLWGYYD